MITQFLNWIKSFFTPERQDPHLEIYEEVRTDKTEKISKHHIKVVKYDIDNNNEK